MLKLIDFGLSSWGIVDRGLPNEAPVPQLVGTPDYMAPEIIARQRHTFTVDYWALGCIVYEMLVGASPFFSDDYETTFAKILNCTYDRAPLAQFSPEVQDFIGRLLQPDPGNRLGSSSVNELTEHPWFADIDWNHLDWLAPPYVPKLSNRADTAYFDFTLDAEGDADIVEDIRLGIRPKSARKEPSFIDSDSFSPPPPSPDSMLEAFPAVGVSELEDLTIRAAQRKLQSRADSFPFVERKHSPPVRPGPSYSAQINFGSLLIPSERDKFPTVLSRSTSRGASKGRTDEDGGNRLTQSDE
jgi:serine/threonine protein kinase